MFCSQMAFSSIARIVGWSSQRRWPNGLGTVGEIISERVGGIIPERRARNRSAVSGKLGLANAATTVDWGINSCSREEARTSEVATGAIETGDEAELDRIGTACEHDGNGCGCRLGARALPGYW
jgi:hypothetical protein